jgi:butyryl-CoA dehydrogenase
MLNERDIEFLLYEFLDSESLSDRERYADHDKETYNAVLKTAMAISEKHLLPIRQKIDLNDPVFENGTVELFPEVKEAYEAIIESGIAFATYDYEKDGMQLPEVVAACASTYLRIAGLTTTTYVGLTVGNANLIEAHGTEEQKRIWGQPLRSGRFSGTMALTEPSVGSGLSDLSTSAIKQDDGTYRITGNKIFISGGDHNLTENIVHLVLARVKGAPNGVKGISLFIVPKFLVNEDGSLGEKNDVALSGLFHKMGWKGTTSTSLSFGEKDGAVGYLVGSENMGLSYMFHMMNEIRLLTGISAAATALGAYNYSLHYAKERPQGRLLAEKNPQSPPVNIIEHPDVRRMLVAQKAYSEGAFAFTLWATQLADDEKSAKTEEERVYAHRLLDFLTPIVKTWPSKFCLRSNYYAIQVLGGHGYVNEHPVEMFYRDNRLNEIHEGTTSIQSLDLIGRKVPFDNFSGYNTCLEEVQKTIDAVSHNDVVSDYADELEKAVTKLKKTTKTVLQARDTLGPDAAFANSVQYLQMFGHILIAWTWLKQGMVASEALAKEPHKADEDFYLGKLQAMRYFFNVELPEIYVWAEILSNLDLSAYDMKAEWL